MSATTGIEWTDATWNPVSGCTRVSSGCDRCYIERTPPFRMAGRRFDGAGIGGTTGVMLHPDRLSQPFRWRKPRRVFVCSLADLFHDDVPEEYIARVWAVMGLAARHTFQVLTKRPARMRNLLASEGFRTEVEDALKGVVAAYSPERVWFETWPLPNVWCGVTAESQKWANRRIPILLDAPAAVRFVSAEPLIGEVWLGDAHLYRPALCPDGCGCKYPEDADRRECACGGPCAEDRRPPDLQWLIAGGESGPRARPMHPQWVRSLRDQCTDAGVSFLYKQWGDWVPVAGADDWRNRLESDHDVRVDGYHWPISQPHGAEDGTEVLMRRVGKKAAGRELDGRTWDEFPRGVPDV